MRVSLKAHPFLPGVFVTPDGRVFQELTGVPGFGGYTTLKINLGRVQTIRRHTLVAETYLPPRPDGHGVRHLDGNPANDHPDNLTWGTQAENMTDMVRHGRSTRGSRNARAKLTEAQAREIKTRRAAGESGRSLAREFNISEQTVACIKTGRQWGWL
jgi:hypothetical protein